MRDFTALRMQNTSELLIMNIFIDWSNYIITSVIVIVIVLLLLFKTAL